MTPCPEYKPTDLLRLSSFRVQPHFPYEHWSRLRTNNGLKRIMKEICRRTRVVGSFPDGYSAMIWSVPSSGIFPPQNEDSTVYEYLQTL